MSKARGRIPAKRAFYDFETYGWKAGEEIKPCAIGVMYGPRGDRMSQVCIDKQDSDKVVAQAFKFFEAIARAEDIYTFVAHNGGRFDSLFLLTYAAKQGWRFKACPVGSTLLTLEVYMPGLKRPLCFGDSMRIVPSSLKNAAKDFELPSKKVLTDDDYAVPANTWTDKRLTEGVLADCEVGLDLLDRVETLFEDAGGHLRLTFSSSALATIKAHVDVPDMREFKQLNMLVEGAYAGGRNEIFWHMPDIKLKMYDISSAYPWAMTQRLPWGDLKLSEQPRRDYNKGKAGVYKVEVEVPEMYIPPLHMRDKMGGLYFPTGKFQGWYTEPELRRAEEKGCTIHKIASAVVAAEYTYPFKEFINKFYATKLEADKNGQEAIRNFAKLVMNGGYGKFGERPNKQEIVFFPDVGEALDAIFDESMPGGRAQEFSVLSPNASPRFLVKHKVNWSKQTNYVLAAYITALPRIRLERMLENSENPAYCDTDSIHCKNYIASKDLPVSATELGALKLEATNVEAVYYASKIYHWHNGEEKAKAEKATKKQGKLVTEQDILKKQEKAKGFRGANMDTLTSGRHVNQERVELARMLMRHDAKSVMRVGVAKRWRGLSTKRRVIDKQGNTEPWTVKAILDCEHLKQASPSRADDYVDEL